MNNGQKIFWDQLFIIYLLTLKNTFTIKIIPSQVVDNEIFDLNYVNIPKHLGIAQKSMVKFFFSAIEQEKVSYAVLTIVTS